jgi:hypothetical protein
MYAHTAEPQMAQNVAYSHLDVLRMNSSFILTTSLAVNVRGTNLGQIQSRPSAPLSLSLVGNDDKAKAVRVWLAECEVRKWDHSWTSYSLRKRSLVKPQIKRWTFLWITTHNTPEILICFGSVTAGFWRTLRPLPDLQQYISDCKLND